LKWISLDELVGIHEQVIAETGGTSGISYHGGLEAALARPFSGLGSEEVFPDLHSKAAALIHSVISFHPFVDGNKRTALVAADACLRLNGHRLVPSEELEPFFWAIARGEKTVEVIADWLRAHIEACQEGDST
jgi:death on curing protein